MIKYKNITKTQKKVEEPVIEISKEEGISFEQVFYILFFNAHLPAFRVESLF